MKSLSLFKNRVGRFTVGMEFIETLDLETLNEVFSNMVIVKAEYLYHRNGIEYTAYCTCFDNIDAGEIIPTYEVLIDNNYFLEWKRVE